MKKLVLCLVLVLCCAFVFADLSIGSGYSYFSLSKENYQGITIAIDYSYTIDSSNLGFCTGGFRSFNLAQDFVPSINGEVLDFSQYDSSFACGFYIGATYKTNTSFCDFNFSLSPCVLFLSNEKKNYNNLFDFSSWATAPGINISCSAKKYINNFFVLMGVDSYLCYGFLGSMANYPRPKEDVYNHSSSFCFLFSPKLCFGIKF